VEEVGSDKRTNLGKDSLTAILLKPGDECLECTGVVCDAIAGCGDLRVRMRLVEKRWGKEETHECVPELSESRYLWTFGYVRY
jgi:hypothetical protein